MVSWELSNHIIVYDYPNVSEKKMEEEEHFDYRSPKGQLIKILEQKSKKPEIDNTLSQVLEKFSELNKRQNMYLENGIFKTNFAEDALLLQHCALYYGKRVDKLWNDLLQLHTRLLQYDQNRNKKTAKRNESSQLELEKLEERINRGRHKKIKLVQSKENKTIGEMYDEQNMILRADDEEQYDVQKPFELDTELMDSWSQLSFSKEKKISKVLMEHSMQPYRLKNYLVPGENDIIYDGDDPEEFNTKQSRLPSYHPIRHLFEYNDRCLLPDTNNTIAKLRMAYMGNQKYLNEKHIHGDALYETYKVGYQKFVKSFFEHERKKIQNMPQEDLRDLHKFYRELERKEKEALFVRSKSNENSQEISTSVTFESLVLGKLFQDLSFADLNAEECELGIPQELANITVDLTESTPADKLRSDSGYFDGGFENDDDDDMNNTDDVERQEANKDLSENKSAPDTKNETSLDINVVQDKQSSINSFTDNLNASSNCIMQNSNVIQEYHQATLSTVENIDNQDFVNVNYSKRLDDTNKNVTHVGHDYIKQTKDMIMIIYNKDHQNNNIVPITRTSKTLGKNIKLKTVMDSKVQNEQRKRELLHKDKLLVKRRKLTAKQIINLKKSLIKPVNELKWESFFSMNYRTEIGEGDVVRTYYEPDFEIEDHFDNISNPDHNTDCEGSHDHDYCRPDSAIDLSRSCVSPAPCASPSAVTQMKGTSDNHPELDKSDEVLDNSFFTNDSGFGTSSLLTQSDSSITEKSVLQNDSGLWSVENERQKIKQSVTEWKSFIEPKLKMLKEKDFDIHKYGSDIMDSMELNETKLFTNLVVGKSPAEVVRYFISSLQLASTCNVEICGVQKGTLSNETLSLKLLNKERYHDHLEEYQAPSEECFTEKLNRIKEIRQHTYTVKASNRQNFKHKSSTSTDCVSSSKKIKILSNCVVARRNGSQGASEPSTSRNHMSVSEVEKIAKHEDSVSDEDTFFDSCSKLSQSTPRKV
ncbi:uncharacterized protein LOC132701109 isoform X2 [Cylas formicarius]|uniref:uncharacterized protein LOC132701109 isoform X2 n=1 Tax=Cylas formicarius TaxID=197179 RepID=UPI0029584DCF|nr:uncharacterized protein LOC132701109 isoform X2 [Cylas formicarius]